MERGHPCPHGFMASDLEKEKWAVLSHLGLEATKLTHEEARRLVHRLASEGRHGLCIISDDAASRLTPAPPSNSRIPESA
jgi:hypothetical protein